MTDDIHVDRYVRLTNRERFLIVRALSLLKDACYTIGIAYDEHKCVMPHMKEVIALSRVFCEENWKKEYHIRYENKVRAVEEQENDD